MSPLHSLCCSSEPPPRATDHRWLPRWRTEILWSWFLLESNPGLSLGWKGDKKSIWDVRELRTCREGELNLFIDDFHGDEVVFLVESAVVEQQSVWLFGGKTKIKKRRVITHFHLLSIIFMIHVNKHGDEIWGIQPPTLLDV